MTFRGLVILGVLALVAIGAGLWLSMRQSLAPADDAAALLYPTLKSQVDSIEAVRIYAAGDRRAVEMRRDRDGWAVTERSGHPADLARLRELLRDLARARILEEKTSDPASYGALGVADVSADDASGSQVEVAIPGGDLNLIVGKRGNGTDSTYVRRASEARSWLVNVGLDVATTPDAWLRKDILDVAADRVQSATITPGSAKGAKPWSASKKSRADVDFSVSGLPKGRELSSPSAANILATALAGLTLTDVRPVGEFASDEPAATATFRTFDGLIVDLSGWIREDKHFIAARASYDRSLADRFRALEPVADDGPDKPSPAAADTPAAASAAPVDEGQAQALNARLSGWVYEIPDYKYDAIFRTLDGLLKG
jgi:Domain of unknown function (DUF4340)